MSKHVHEIMNREVLTFSPEETAENALADLATLGVSGAPVVDETGRPLGVVSWRNLVDAPSETHIAERMTSPVITVSESDTIVHAADLLAESGVHRLFVIDASGRIAGALSILDVLRAMTGRAVRHPPAFPHLDRSGVTWTDDEPFELGASDAAPNGPGVLLVVENTTGETDDVVLAEATPNVRNRLIELLSVPQSERPALALVLEHPSGLRFRAAAIDDVRKRRAIARSVRACATRQLRASVLR
jgi:CBS domain-containing protein